MWSTTRRGEAKNLIKLNGWRKPHFPTHPNPAVSHRDLGQLVMHTRACLLPPPCPKRIPESGFHEHRPGDLCWFPSSSQLASCYGVIWRSTDQAITWALRNQEAPIRAFHSSGPVTIALAFKFSERQSPPFLPPGQSARSPSLVGERRMRMRSVAFRYRHSCAVRLRPSGPGRGLSCLGLFGTGDRSKILRWHRTLVSVT
jgi:hypothetical protein